MGKNLQSTSRWLGRAGAAALFVPVVLGGTAHAAVFGETLEGLVNGGTSNDVQINGASNTSQTVDGLTASAYGMAEVVGGAPVFHASASVSGTYAGTAGDRPIAIGLAGFAGQYVISSPGQSGTGTLAIDFSLDGTLSGTGGPFSESVFGTVCLSFGCTDPATKYVQTMRYFDGAGSSTVSIQDGHVATIQFTYGQTFDLQVFLQANATFQGVNGSSGNASADFADTASVLPLTIRNSSGDLDGAANIVTENGPALQVFDGQAPVPEPATWGELLLGLFGLGWVLRRQGPALIAAR